MKLDVGQVGNLLDSVIRQPGALYRPGRDFDPFHRSTHPRRMLRAPNQVGKTNAAAKEADWFMSGRHPYRKVRTPNVGWVLLADLDHGWPIISQKFFEVMSNRGDLDPRCRFDRERGFFVGSRRMVLYRNGSRMEPRSGVGEVTAVASGTIDWGWIDEVPKQHHFGEFLSRVAVRRGPIWMSFTPIGRPVDWLRLHVEGDAEKNIPPRESWTQFVPELSAANCWWRTEEDIEAQKAGYGPWEYAQRVYGAWEGITEGRRFTGFTEDNVVDEIPALEEPRFGVWMDHGEGAGRQVALLAAWVRGRMYVLDEYVNTMVTTPEQDARGILEMLKRRGLTLEDIDNWVGDVNSAGKANGGGSVNQELERAFARLAGYPILRPPFRISKPSKGKGSIESGERLVNAALARHQVKVHKRCKNLVKSLMHYAGEEDLKHPIDAFRYGAVPVIEKWTVPGVPYVEIRGR